MSLVFPGIPIPVIEVVMWGKSAERIQWEHKVQVRTGWNVVDRVSPNHVLLIRPLDDERDEACVMREDESSYRMVPLSSVLMPSEVG